MKAVIVAYGETMEISELKKICIDSDIIICADGGGKYIFEAGLIPDYLIGDFDSLDRNILNYFENRNVNIIRYPREKDFTDTELCVLKAIELGCNDICIISGIGGRFDHSLGNVALLHFIKEKGANGYIKSEYCDIFLCSDELEIKGKIGDIISLIPFKNSASGLFTTGLKYSLNGEDIKFGRCIGISNVMINDTCTIKVSNGEILVIKQN
ncbi:hypothetical protein Q428_03135 [Fervidicella metallireducens AeB]|uniref:Thiamine diphosphokinase n=1 Tax=Fervidicella metallireducens AeB TaxID=1403537 RepID=A0A017RWX2_9CLOT|nr:thiamine diphosphokinase [Fervidicella metallireducens]EYE89283.1 hypothetical protein Q428_03135 [Fervidicella metallireducens AeB]